MDPVYRYASIAFCAAACWMVLILRRRETAAALPAGERFLIPAAMAGTLLADTFLVLLDSHYTAGVLCFSLVQTLYAVLIGLRLSRQKRLARVNIFVRPALLFALLCLLALSGALDLLSGAAAYSMAMLSANVVFAAAAARQEKKQPAAPSAGAPAFGLFALGLALFWGCDLCMGLFNAPDYFTDFPEAVSRVAGRLVWVFYLPSQIMIVLAYALAGKYRRENDDTE